MAEILCQVVPSDWCKELTAQRDRSFARLGLRSADAFVREFASFKIRKPRNQEAKDAVIPAFLIESQFLTINSEKNARMRAFAHFFDYGARSNSLAAEF